MTEFISVLGCWVLGATGAGALVLVLVLLVLVLSVLVLNVLKCRQWHGAEAATFSRHSPRESHFAL
jgi:hypothetical protein